MEIPCSGVGCGQPGRNSVQGLIQRAAHTRALVRVVNAQHDGTESRKEEEGTM